MHPKITIIWQNIRKEYLTLNRCDTVLHRRNGSYALLEAKLGGEDRINEGAANLLALANIIDRNKMPSPSFMAVITAVGQYAYQRKDGVLVLPIGCIKD